jgi:hypothetical protein
MNENRNVFGLNGVTGMLIATVLLLSILVVLTMGALNVQHENAENFYEVKDEQSIKMFSTENAKHIVDVK